MTCKERLIEYLERQGVPFEVQHHQPAYTAQRVAAAEHIPGRQLVKVVMAWWEGRPVAFVMPAPYHLNVAHARELLGGEVRISREDEFAPVFPDCAPGAMPPFGNLYGVPVYAERTLAANETIVFQAGTHVDTMSVRYEDFERLVRPVLGDFGVSPRERERAAS